MICTMAPSAVVVHKLESLQNTHDLLLNLRLHRELPDWLWDNFVGLDSLLYFGGESPTVHFLPDDERNDGDGLLVPSIREPLLSFLTHGTTVFIKMPIFSVIRLSRSIILYSLHVGSISATRAKHASSFRLHALLSNLQAFLRAPSFLASANSCR